MSILLDKLHFWFNRPERDWTSGSRQEDCTGHGGECKRTHLCQPVLSRLPLPSRLLLLKEQTTGGQAGGWRGPRRIVNTTSARGCICSWGRMDNPSCFEAKTGTIRNGWFMSSSFLFFFSVGISEYNRLIFQVLSVTCSAQWTQKGDLERNRISCFPSSSSSPS